VFEACTSWQYNPINLSRSLRSMFERQAWSSSFLRCQQLVNFLHNFPIIIKPCVHWDYVAKTRCGYSVYQWYFSWPLLKLEIGQIKVNKYVGPPYCRAEMYAGRVACCFLVSHDEYANGTDKQTERQSQTVTFRFSLWTGQRYKSGIEREQKMIFGRWGRRRWQLSERTI